MTIPTAVTTATVALAAAAATFAGAAQAQLVKCGTATAAGWKFQVEVANIPCSSARALTEKLASKGIPSKPTPYPGVYLKMHCFGTSGKAQGQRVAMVQCTGDNESLYAVARR